MGPALLAPLPALALLPPTPRFDRMKREHTTDDYDGADCSSQQEHKRVGPLVRALRPRGPVVRRHRRRHACRGKIVHRHRRQLIQQTRHRRAAGRRSRFGRAGTGFGALAARAVTVNTCPHDWFLHRACLPAKDSATRYFFWHLGQKISMTDPFRASIHSDNGEGPRRRGVFRRWVLETLGPTPPLNGL